MSVYTRTDTVTVKGVQFEAILWIDHSDMTVDVEASALVQSKYLAYPGSSLVPLEVNVYSLPLGDWLSHFEPSALAAIAAA